MKEQDERLTIDTGTSGKPKLVLCRYPTPVDKINYTVTGCHIHMKREDLIGIFGGGNKVRFYEYLIPDILASMPDRLVTVGSVHSNHVRVVAAVAAFLKIPCDLFIYSDMPADDKEPLEGNLILARTFGANIIRVVKNFSLLTINEYLEEQQAKGIHCYYIPLGGHLPLSTLGYADVMMEIQRQSVMMSIPFDYIFTPCGSGTTQAGLIIGKAMTGYRGDIFGITVEKTPERCRQDIKRLISHVNTDILCLQGEPDIKINVIENHIGYGEMNAGIVSITKAIGASDGIILDPVYNAKSFLRMCGYIQENGLTGNILYINTGGMPNVFMGRAAQNDMPPER